MHKTQRISQEYSNRLMTMSPRVVEAFPALEPRPKNGAWKYPVSVPYIAPGAKQNVIRALEKGLISSATSSVKDMEAALRDFFQVPMAKACNTGYASLVIGLRLGNLGPGDEVLVPSLTMVAVANAVLTVGATPVFVDCAPGKLNPGLEEYEAKRTESTKALVVTYTYGTSVNGKAIRKYCDTHGLVFIEDISEAFGTICDGQLAGTFGDFGCGSLYANKIITAGDGGFVISRHKDAANFDRATSLTNHAFVKYHHFVHFDHSGNYKMSGLAAALVTPAIPLTPEVLYHRSFIARCYRKFLSDVDHIALMEKSEFGPDAPWVFGVECASKSLKDTIRATMAEKYGIETRDYFFPIHLQPLYQTPGKEPDHLPNAESLGQCGFYLPTHYYLSEDDMLYIANAVKCGISAFKSMEQ